MSRHAQRCLASIALAMSVVACETVVDVGGPPIAPEPPPGGRRFAASLWLSDGTLDVLGARPLLGPLPMAKTASSAVLEYELIDRADRVIASGTVPDPRPAAVESFGAAGFERDL